MSDDDDDDDDDDPLWDQKLEPRPDQSSLI